MILLPLLIAGLGMGASDASASGAASITASGPDTMPGWTVTGAAGFGEALQTDDEGTTYVSTTVNQSSGEIPLDPTDVFPICGLKFELQARKTGVGFGTSTVVGHINRGGSTIATTPAFELTGAWAVYSYHLTPAELAELGDATDLSIQLVVSGIDGSLQVDVSHIGVDVDPCVITTADPVDPDPPGPSVPPGVFNLEPASGVRLNPRWPVRRVDGGVTLESGGPQRHTRNPHERQPRRYELILHLAPPEELELAREAVQETLGGATAVSWRHPTDDPPLPAAGTLYRIMNAHEASISIQRARAGQSAEFTLTLEEI